MQAMDAVTWNMVQMTQLILQPFYKSLTCSSKQITKVYLISQSAMNTITTLLKDHGWPAYTESAVQSCLNLWVRLSTGFRMLKPQYRQLWLVLQSISSRKTNVATAHEKLYSASSEELDRGNCRGRGHNWSETSSMTRGVVSLAWSVF